MRQIILDTETTGLNPENGHRIIEIGAIELINRHATSRTFHYYVNPERDIEFAAQEVHGITHEFLRDKPLFSEIVEEFLEFIQAAELIIHNAPFDLSFLNSELSLINYSSPQRIEDICQIVDTLTLARQKHPGQKNSLDALCRRYNIDHSHRDLHGALLDARLLADVYLAMTGGQASLFEEETNHDFLVNNPSHHPAINPDSLLIIYANQLELKEHQACLEQINKISAEKCLWLLDDIVQ